MTWLSGRKIMGMQGRFGLRTTYWRDVFLLNELNDAYVRQSCRLHNRLRMAEPFQNYIETVVRYGLA